MIHKRFKKLSKLPPNTPISKVLTVEQYAKKRGVTVSAIYLTIDRVMEKVLKWNQYQCYQHNGKIVIIERT